MSKYNQWYKTAIEPRIRPIVKLLRDNGINTTCSCEHEMYVDASNDLGGVIDDIDHLLFNDLCRRHKPIDYVITATLMRQHGLKWFSNLEISLAKEKKGKDLVILDTACPKCHSKGSLRAWVHLTVVERVVVYVECSNCGYQFPKSSKVWRYAMASIDNVVYPDDTLMPELVEIGRIYKIVHYAIKQARETVDAHREQESNTRPHSG